MRLKSSTTRRVLGTTLWAFMLVGSGCVNDITTGGPVSTREYSYAEFTAVQVISTPTGTQVYHRFEVDIAPADKYSVAVTADDNLFKHIRVSRSGSTLRIVLSDVQVSFAPATLEAKIAMPRLWQLTASGAAVATARGFKSIDDFKLQVSGGARADLDLETGGFAASISDGRARGSVTCANAQIEVFGSRGAAEFAGSAGDLVLRGGGGSEAYLREFPVRNADVTLMGLGTRADVTVNGQLDVTLIGPSVLSYSGGATLGRASEGRGSILRQRP